MYRSAPPPPELRRAALDAATQAYEPDRARRSRWATCSRCRRSPTRSHIRTTVSLQRRLGVVRDLLRSRKTLDFDDAFGSEDRFTQAVTLFALLELYRRGEATWTQKETFGRIEVRGAVSADGLELARIVEALLFLSPEPVSAAELAEAIEVDEEAVAEAIDELEQRLRGATSGECGCAASPAASRWPRSPRRRTAARRLLAKPRTPPLTQAQAEVLAIVAYLQPVSRPEIARIRGVSSDSAVSSLTERGMIEERGRTPLRRRHLRHDAAVREALRPLRARRPARSGPVRSDARGRARAARAPAEGG